MSPTRCIQDPRPISDVSTSDICTHMTPGLSSGRKNITSQSGRSGSPTPRPTSSRSPTPTGAVKWIVPRPARLGRKLRVASTSGGADLLQLTPFFVRGRAEREGDPIRVPPVVWGGSLQTLETTGIGLMTLDLQSYLLRMSDSLTFTETKVRLGTTGGQTGIRKELSWFFKVTF